MFRQRCRQVLLSKITDFQEILPLIENLRKPSIKPRHWQEIMDIIKTSLPYELENFSLANIMDSPILNFKDDVEEVFDSTSRELIYSVSIPGPNSSYIRVLGRKYCANTGLSIGLFLGSLSPQKISDSSSLYTYPSEKPSTVSWTVYSSFFHRLYTRKPISWSFIVVFVKPYPYFRLIATKQTLLWCILVVVKTCQRNPECRSCSIW